MRVKIRKEDVWVPDWEGNLDEPEGQQVKFRHRYPSADERKRFIYTRPIKGVSKKEDQAWEMEIVQDGKGLAQLVHLGIDNLEYEDDNGKVVAVVSTDDLYRSPFSDLVRMYEAYLLDASAVVDPKNSP